MILTPLPSESHLCGAENTRAGVLVLSSQRPLRQGKHGPASCVACALDTRMPMLTGAAGVGQTRGPPLPALSPAE